MSDDDTETLQPLGDEQVAFLIKGFPRPYRDQVVAAARVRGVSVAVWLTAHFDKFGIDGAALDLKPPQRLPASIHARPPSGGSVADTLATVAAAIGALAGTRGVPKATRQAIHATALLVLRDVRQSLGEPLAIGDESGG